MSLIKYKHSRIAGMYAVGLENYFATERRYTMISGITDARSRDELKD